MKHHSIATVLSIATAILLVLNVSAETLKQNIQEALDAGDTAKAIRLLESEIEVDQSYHYNYYILGRIYYDRGDYNSSAGQFRTALDKKKKHYESLLYLSRSLLNLGNLDEAEGYIREGLKKAKDLKDKFEYCHGLLLMAREDYAGADVAFRRAIALDSLDADYHLALGDANFYQDVPALAILEYETALALDTASTEVYFHWAEACLQLKDYTCAIEKLRIVLSKDSTHAEAWNRAGGIYFKAARSSRTYQERKDRFIDAIGSYNKYLELSGAQPDSSSVRVFFEMAMAYASVFGFEDAVTYFEKVLSIPYEPKDIYFWYGKSLWGIKDYERSTQVLLKHAEWVSQQGPDYSTGVNQAEYNQLLGDGYFYRQPKDYVNAVKYYKLSLQEEPGQKRLLQNVAIAYHNMKSYSQALEYYDLRIDQGIDSNSVSIYRNAGLCALNIAGGSAGDDEFELEELEDEEGLMSTDDPTGDLGVNPGINYYELAVDYMNKYLDLFPDDTAVILRVANTYLYQLTDCANGVSYFERLLALNPNNCQAMSALGFAYFGGTICQKNYSKALGYLLQAYDCMGSPCADAALVKWIAQCYHLRATDKEGDANSDYKNAFEWYGKCLKCDPNDNDCQEGQNDTRFEFN